MRQTKNEKQTNNKKQPHASSGCQLSMASPVSSEMQMMLHGEPLGSQFAASFTKAADPSNSYFLLIKL